METADVVVVGGGSIGASTAVHLAEQGAGRVVLLEQKNLAHGASGKGIGIIRTHYTHPVLARLALRSLEIFHHFEERFGGHSAGFHPCGYFILVGEDDRQTLARLVAMHQDMGITVEQVPLETVQSQIPYLNLQDVAVAAHEPRSGYGSPPQTTLALAQRAVELGVDVRTQTPVLEIVRDAEGGVAAVVTPQGQIQTRTVVDCVGSWARTFAEHLGLEFPVFPVVEHVVVVARPAAEAAFHPVVSDLVNLCYFRSDSDQPWTRVGNSDPSYHPGFRLADADSFHGQFYEEMGGILHQKLLHRFPGAAAGHVVERYSGIWGITPDYQPILDRLTYAPGLYCAVGFSGHGYKLSPVIGDLMSRWILAGEAPEPEVLNLFRWSRFAENEPIKAPLSYSRAVGLR